MLHGGGARFLSTVRPDHSSWEAQVGQLQAQLVQTQQELQYAIEKIRILTLQVNSNASAAAAAVTTTAPATTTANSHSQMPKVNYQFGKDIISKHLRRQTEERLSEVGRKLSAVSISTVC